MLFTAVSESLVELETYLRETYASAKVICLLLLLLLLLLEPLPGVHHLMTQDNTSLFLVLLVEC